jgi:low temperature requirement protein LtrA
MTARIPNRDDELRVSTVELFFDLVFVFTLTQVTIMVAHHPSWTRVAEAELIFANVWYLYGAYAWLTNAVPPRGATFRLLLFLGMVGFFVVALAVPGAFDDNGLAFGVGYALATVVNTVLFLRTDPETVTRTFGRFRPFNATAAALVLAGGFANGGWRWALWIAAFLVHWTEAPLFGVTDVGVRGGHFVERHGLLLLIALGESVIAVGSSLDAASLGTGELVSAVVGLTLVGALWWLYFDGDDDRAERALYDATPRRRALLALYGFGYGFLLVLGGVIVLAAGLERSLPHYDRAVDGWTAAFVAGGVATYVTGLALLRTLLGIGRADIRFAIAVVAVASVVVGLWGSGLAQVVTLTVVVVAGIVVESRAEPNHTSERRRR